VYNRLFCPYDPFSLFFPETIREYSRKQYHGVENPAQFL
jgi:hypothetical protein